MLWKQRMPVDLTRYWYRQSHHIVTILLLPLAWLFGCLAALRRYFYRAGVLTIHHFPKPVIVVGNISVGGTGKTPLVIWLTQFLQSQGYRPGIVSRGVGGKEGNKPRWVRSDDAANLVGDEALLLAQRTNCPVVISKDRVAAVNELLNKTDCNIVISDDGLQHYRMGRDIEIAVVDGARRFGNQQLLPAGPLREPISRLQRIDFVVVNGGSEQDTYQMQLENRGIVALQQATVTYALNEFPYRIVNAVAAIGNPQRFFQSLTDQGLNIIPHAFSDHHLYQAEELIFNNDYPIVMTEKDAVKCRAFANSSYWYVPVTAIINKAFQENLLLKLKKRGDEE